MEHFFDTSHTMPSGMGFSHYDPLHLSWLGSFVCLAIIGCLVYRRLASVGRRRMRRLLAFLTVGDEIFKIVCLASHGNYSVDYLPLHLCSINILIIALHAIKPNETLDNFLYAIGLPAALAALLFPSWTKLPLQNFMHLHSFSVHILLALYPFILTVCGDIRPRLRKLPKCLLLLAFFACVAAACNYLTRDMEFATNFMFLDHADKGNPLYLFEQQFGSHLYGFPVLIVAVLLVMYTPWVIVDHLKKRKKETSLPKNA